MSCSLPKDSLVLVTGGSGYLGLSIMGYLVNIGFRVRAIARSDRARERIEKVYGQTIEIVPGDMTDVESLVTALRGVAGVVHLAARKADENDSYAVNVGGSINLAAACGFTGVRRFINVSTLAANLPRRGVYGETKALADSILHRAGLDITTLRLSLVYSEQPEGVFAQIVRMVRCLPIVPIIGRNGGRFWPIHVHDVAVVVGPCLERGLGVGSMYEIGGPDEVTLVDLVRMIAEALGLKRLVLPIPTALAMVLAEVTGRIFSRPPITVSNVLGAIQRPVFDSGPALREFGYQARGLKVGLREALAGI